MVERKSGGKRRMAIKNETIMRKSREEDSCQHDCAGASSSRLCLTIKALEMTKRPRQRTL